MGRCHSLDLRERVVAFVAEGRSRRSAARQFAVSASCAVKLLQQQDRTDSPAPARQGRPLGSGQLVPFEGFLIGEVKAKPDMTMPELAERLLSEHGVKAAPDPPPISRTRGLARVPFGLLGRDVAES